MPIAKLIKGSHTDGCLRYVLGKEGVTLLQTNCVGRTPSELAYEFRLGVDAVLQTTNRRNLKHTLLHTTIGFPLDSNLSREQKVEIAQDYLDQMGFDLNFHPHVIAEHSDTQHQHIHVMVSRAGLDGRVVSDWQDYRRAEELMRKYESRYQLKAVPNSWEIDVKAPSVGEVRHSRSTGMLITRQSIQSAIESCAPQSQNLSQLKQKLAEFGVELEWELRFSKVKQKQENENGRRSIQLCSNWCLFYKCDGLTFSGSKLGSRYTYKGLNDKFGVNVSASDSANEKPQTGDTSGIGAAIPVELQETDLTARPARPIRVRSDQLIDLAELIAQARSKGRSDQSEVSSEVETPAPSDINLIFTTPVVGEGGHEPDRASDQASDGSKIKEIQTGVPQSGQSNQNTAVTAPQTPTERQVYQEAWRKLEERIAQSAVDRNQRLVFGAICLKLEGVSDPEILKVLSQSPQIQQIYSKYGKQTTAQQLQQILARSIQQIERMKQNQKRSSR